MIQVQALNYLINSKDIDFLTTYGKEYYFNYENEYNFILDHYHKYKNIPDMATMLDGFPEFSVISVSESREYLENRLFEEYVFETISDYMNDEKTADKFSKNAIQAKTELLNKLQSLQQPKKSYGEDIIKTAQSRYDAFLDHIAHPDEYYISTGLTELDFILGGGLRRGEELVVVFARTGNCKSWISEKILTSAWEQDLNVGFFSPEMTSKAVGYRFDTLYKHFNNNGIQGNIADFDGEAYKKYIKELQSKKLPIFSVTTPFDFDKKVTVSKLKKWVEALDLKMIVIDGVKYLENERGYKQAEHDRLTDLSEDLMSLSIEMGIPIIEVVQANRVGARDKDGDVNTDAPEIDTIRGSDGISHNASRILSVVHNRTTKGSAGSLTMYLNKNRYGQDGNKLIYTYDINTGTFTYVNNPKSGIDIEPDTTTDETFNDSADAF